MIEDSSIEVGLPVPPDGGEALAQGTPQATGVVSAATAVVLDYCTAVKGILNDDQGGPLQPSGLRMAAALTTVRESLERNIQAKKGALRRAR